MLMVALLYFCDEMTESHFSRSAMAIMTVFVCEEWTELMKYDLSSLRADSPLPVGMRPTCQHNYGNSKLRHFEII